MYLEKTFQVFIRAVGVQIAKVKIAAHDIALLMQTLQKN